MTAAPVTGRQSAAVNAVARETLRRIAAERISPTPEAYARIYAEIAATHPDRPDAAPPRPDGQDGKSTASIIGRLLTQLDVPHAGITVTRKKDGLKRALVPRLEPLDALHARLHRLMDSWNGPNAETGTQVSAFLGTDIFGDAFCAERSATSSPFAAPPRAGAEPLRPPGAARAASATSEVPEQLVSFRLAGLLALLLKNIDDLTPESALVTSQVEQIGRVLTAPLTEKKLDEAERCIRALVVRQGAIKHSINETKRAMRELAETLLDKLSAIATSTDSYATNVVELAEQIASTNDLGKLSDLTQILVTDARALSANVGAERALLVEAQERARALQERTAALEGELKEAETLVRTDPLTSALNRRGFAEAFKEELVRVKGGALPSVVLLDVDDFKRINERHGHSIGDEVLCNLVAVLQRAAGAPNVVARYGGEEFALMMPHTDAQEAEAAVARIQAALGEHFAAGATHLPQITFSAGVARVAVQETLAHVVTRADRAMRHAKQNGKNCIVVASMQEAAVG